MLDDQLPDVLDFSKDVANLEPAAKVLDFSKALQFIVLIGIVLTLT